MRAERMDVEPRCGEGRGARGTLGSTRRQTMLGQCWMTYLEILVAWLRLRATWLSAIASNFESSWLSRRLSRELSHWETIHYLRLSNGYQMAIKWLSKWLSNGYPLVISLEYSGIGYRFFGDQTVAANGIRPRRKSVGVMFAVVRFVYP